MKLRNFVIVIMAVFLAGCETFSEVDIPVESIKPEPIKSAESINPVESIKPAEPTSKTIKLVEPIKPFVSVVVPEIDVRVIGQVEYVDIMPAGIRQKARIDTGAETTSIGAQNIQQFERDGRRWVKFKVYYGGEEDVVEFVKPMERRVLIKRHGTENVERPVVKMRLAIGSIEQELEVSLADRLQFQYPVLIGRNFLDGKVLVDVSRKFLMLDK